MNRIGEKKQWSSGKEDILESDEGCEGRRGKKESSKIRVTFTKHWSSVRHCSKRFRWANSLDARYTPTRQGGTTRGGGTRWACEVNPHKGPTGTETACHTPQSTANVQNLESLF